MSRHRNVMGKEEEEEEGYTASLVDDLIEARTNIKSRGWHVLIKFSFAYQFHNCLILNSYSIAAIRLLGDMLTFSFYLSSKQRQTELKK